MTNPVSTFKHITQVSILSIFKLTIGLFVYLNLNSELLLLLLVLTISDVITGIGRSRSLGCEYISKKLLDGLKKKSSYYGAIFVVAFGVKGIEVAGYGYYGAVHEIVGIFIAGIIAGEAISNLQNLYVIYSGEDVGEFDVIKIVFKSTVKVFKNLVVRITNKK